MRNEPRALSRLEEHGAIKGHDKMSIFKRGNGKPNRLAGEKSPYLLQHADNPVDWYPWGEEAFDRAARDDRPVFLSIGYSTCHWCHVMAHESFEDHEVAGALNRAFVSVKVDREERPDIDGVYMTACQMMTGSGGWPLTIIMTPDKRPFFAATYIPRHSKYGRTGMTELVPMVGRLWEKEREKVLDTASQMARSLEETSAGNPGEPLGEGHLDKMHDALVQRYDPEHGGFSRPPKFPSPHNILFMLRHWRRTGDDGTLDMVRHTLDAMRLGGMYDHVGFGFHRYSTDAKWLVPHFEKMLYDQALLAMAYLDGYEATGDELYASTARDIFTYVRRDLTSEEGAFFVGEDADSEGMEGKFYVWTAGELDEVLGDDARRAIRAFNVTREGNFREEATHSLTGANILHPGKRVEKLADEFEMEASKFAAQLEDIRRRLFEARRLRVPPLKDDKVLTDWNALMIAAFAIGARVLGDNGYREAAEKAARFIIKTMKGDDGRLLHRYRGGDAAIHGFADDYAFLTWGLLELHETTGEKGYLEEASLLNKHLLEHFWDGKNGGLYFSPDYGEKLPARMKEAYDGALPSANSVAMMNLVRLSRLTGDDGLMERAREIGMAFSREVERVPLGHSHMMSAVEEMLDKRG
jgi:uncharacterized protein YyaL (SSP411 family)